MQEEKTKEFLALLFSIIKEIQAHFPKDRIQLEDDFEKDLGLDSLTRFELFSRVQEKLNISLSQEALYELQNPKELLSFILKLKDKSSFITFETKTLLKQEDILSSPTKAKTLIDVLKWHIKEHPNRIHIQFYKENENGEQITYLQLYEKALEVAYTLQKLGLKPLECVAIMLPTCAEYFYSFFGILLAGGVPVPIYPPSRPSQIEEHIQRHTRILDNCETSILITIPEAKLVATVLKSYVQNIKEIITPKELLQGKKATLLPKVCEKDIAFIQYTSGSTGNPKGVVLTHANVLTNIKAMGERVGVTSKDVFVSWLPLYHDMGLIASWLGSLYFSSLFVVMSPLYFLSKPQRWFWAIHKYGGTLSASPNFAYEYSLHRLKDVDLKGLDLSSWRVAFNGAEAVSASTMKGFNDYFKNYGLKKEAMTPVYGLAESTVGLVFSNTNSFFKVDRIQRDLFMKSGIAKATKKEPYLEFISSGLPLNGHQIRIVDSFGHELPAGHEGALQFKGPSSTCGYYKNLEKTKELIDKSWLNTGDKAYISQGELYITGRVKDIIIRAGRNIYPDQLEKAVGSIEGIRKGCVAVFGTIDKRSATERLVILAETKLTNKEQKAVIVKKISQLANDLLGAPADEIVLSQPGSVLKTTSGKIRRLATKEFFEKNRGKAQTQNLQLQLAKLAFKSAFHSTKRFFNFTKAHFLSAYNWLLCFIIGFSAWISIFILPSSLSYKTARFYVKMLALFSSISTKVKGVEKLKKRDEKTIIVANHCSYLDAFVLLATLPTEISFVAKSELQKSFFTRVPLEKLGVYFVERYNLSQSIKDAQAFYSYDKKRALLFFPEGTFTRIPGLRHFHQGAFLLAAKKEYEVIPIAIEGTRSILRADEWFINQGEIVVSIGEAISLNKEQKGLSQWDKSMILSNKSREFILSHCKEPDLIYE